MLSNVYGLNTIKMYQHISEITKHQNKNISSGSEKGELILTPSEIRPRVNLKLKLLLTFYQLICL